MLEVGTILLLYKSLTLFGLVLSALNVTYIIDRKINRISKAAVHLGSIIFILNLLEFFKFEVEKITLLEKFQDVLLLYIPVMLFSFIIDFTMGKKNRNLMAILYTLSTSYLILALTNKFHNMFWIAEIETSMYGSQKLRPHGGLLSWAYVFFSVVLLVLALRNLYASKLLDNQTKFRTNLVFAFGISGSIISFLINFNYSALLFVLTLTVFFHELYGNKFYMAKALT